MRRIKEIWLYTCCLLLPSVAFAGSIAYSWQLGTFRSRSQAEKFLENLPTSLKKKSFIYITDSGKVTVRFDVAETVRKLKQEKNLLEKFGISGAFIVPTDANKVKGFTGEKKKNTLYYSVQLGTFQSYKKTARYLNNLPESIKRDAFIYRTDRGLYTVRIGLSKSIKDLKKFSKKLSLLGIKNFFFAPTSPRKIEKKLYKTVTANLNNREEILKTSLRIFLGNNNLKKAFEVARRGTVLFPEHKFWWEWLAKISLWLDNQPVALQAYKKLYFSFNEEKVFHRTYSLALVLGDEETAQKLIEEEIKKGHKVLFYKDLIAFFRKMGNIDKGIELAEKVYGNNPQLIREAAFIYWFYGEKQKALKELEKLKILKKYTYNDALIEAKIFISDRKFDKALQVLKNNADSVPKSLTDYWQLMGNLAWALGDYETAARASETLVNTGKGKDFDYSRIILFYASVNPEKAMKYALEGYKATGIEDFMIDFLSLASKLKRWKLIISTIDSLPEAEKRRLLSENYPLSVYVLALSNIGKVKKAKSLMEIELKNRKNTELIEQYIYFLMDNQDIKDLEKALFNYKKYAVLNPYPFIAAYLYLQNGKEALKLIKSVKIPPSDFSMLLTKADILELYGKPEEARAIRFNLFKKMKKIIEKQGMFKNPDELVSYLRVAMYYEPLWKFERELQASQKFLPPKVYKELYYSFLLKSGQTEKVDYLVTRHREDVSKWLQLNLALYEDDRYKMMKLTSNYGPVLPIRDRVTALTLEGKPGKALNTAFIKLTHNPYDEELYKQLRDLNTQYRNYGVISETLEDRSGLYDIRTDFSFKYGKKGNGVYAGIHQSNTKFLNKSEYRKLFDRYATDLYVEKLFSTGSAKLSFNIIKNKSTNVGLTLTYRTLLNHRTEVKVEGSSATTADESVYLMSAGYKSTAGIYISYPVMNSLTLTSNIEWNKYFSSDRKNLGSGTNLYEEILYKLRAGYPDFTFKTYVLKTFYNEKNHTNTAVDEMTYYPPADALPESSMEVGIGFEFGYENKYNYVRVWRPFFNISTGYNTVYGWGVSTGGGIGGMLVGKDNLNLGFSYSINPQATGDRIFKFEINYKKWF
ncbi:tetratricopeptide repeat protein [Desulfurobacterium sp.]